VVEKKRSLGRGLGALIPNRFKDSDETEDAETVRSEHLSAGGVGYVENETAQDDGIERAKDDTAEIKPVRQDPTDIIFGPKYATTDEAESVSAPINPQAETAPGYFDEIEITAIRANKNQPRTIFDEADLLELSESIAQVGVLQPIIVREISEKGITGEQEYEIVMGERRFRASKLAGLTKVPVIVRRTSYNDMFRDALLENIHRVDLNPLEEAAAYQQLLQEFDITQEALSSRIAVSRSTIANTLRLLKLPVNVQQKVAANVLTAGHARAILSLKDANNIERFAEKIVRENLSVRNAEEFAAMINAGGVIKDKVPNKAQRTPPDIDEKTERVIENIMDALDTEVLVKPKKKSGGSIVISYADSEDLERIGEIIASSLDN
jgi:ParB family chromosome partitioning protein